MAEKFLGIIQNFSKNDLTEFFNNNGYSEFIEVLNIGQISDGQKFLNLDELQMIKMKLPYAMKKKLLAFLSDLKQNPQKYLPKTNIEKQSVFQRRPSVQTRPDFKLKLEQVINKPADSKQPLPQRAQEQKRSPSPAHEEYLEMDQGKGNNLGAHYDESGYLIPIEKVNTVEENEYEPTPSEKVVTNFRSIPISHRPPLALPRPTTDERGYIQGPTNPPTGDSETPPLFPRNAQRNQKNQKNMPFKSRISTPSPTPIPPPKITTQEKSDEEVAYEPVDDEEKQVPTQPVPEGIPPSEEIQTGTLGRFANLKFWKKGRKPEQHNYENDFKLKPQESNIKKEPNNTFPRTRSPVQNSKITSRPLPPLPVSPKEVNFPTLDEPLESYENIQKGHLSNEGMSRLNVQIASAYGSSDSFVSDRSKSKSESSLAPSEDSVTYGNLGENKKPKFPESYEQFHVENSKTGKRPLPLPPTSLPQINLADLKGGKHDEDDEPEDYGNIIFNLNDDPFYRNTDRKGAKYLLYDLDDGAFLFRPSKRFFLTLSLKFNKKCFNLGIEKTQSNRIRLNTSGSNMSPEFPTLTDFVEHFMREPLTFEHQGVVIETLLSKALPPDRF